MYDFIEEIENRKKRALDELLSKENSNLTGVLKEGYHQPRNLLLEANQTETMAATVTPISIVITMLAVIFLFCVYVKNSPHHKSEKISSIKGVKRLFLAASILWMLMVISVSFSSFDKLEAVENMIVYSMPIWLNWGFYWFYIEFKERREHSATMLFLICYSLVFVLLVILSCKVGGEVLFLLNLPIWFCCLVYWVILGFKK